MWSANCFNLLRRLLCIKGHLREHQGISSAGCNRLRGASNCSNYVEDCRVFADYLECSSTGQEQPYTPANWQPPMQGRGFKGKLVKESSVECFIWHLVIILPCRLNNGTFATPRATSHATTDIPRTMTLTHTCFPAVHLCAFQIVCMANVKVQAIAHVMLDGKQSDAAIEVNIKC